MHRNSQNKREKNQKKKLYKFIRMMEWNQEAQLLLNEGEMMMELFLLKEMVGEDELTVMFVWWIDCF